MDAMLPGVLGTFRRMRIAHLRDLHLTRGPLAAQPAAGLTGALGRLLALEPRPDCVVITGDLADTGHPDEYAALRAILRKCPLPVHLLRATTTSRPPWSPGSATRRTWATTYPPPIRWSTRRPP